MLCYTAKEPSIPAFYFVYTGFIREIIDMKCTCLVFLICSQNRLTRRRRRLCIPRQLGPTWYLSKSLLQAPEANREKSDKQ